MNKFFEVLTKPAKWILIIGSFIYAAWYAISMASGINGNFMNVIVHLILLFVGTSLLVAVPILVLLKKDEMAKIVFLILVGYWLLSSILEEYGLASFRCDQTNDAGAITEGIFMFIAGSCLLAVLVFIVLEFALKKPMMRFFAFLVFIVVILFSFMAGLFAFINAIRWKGPWQSVIDPMVEYMLLPIVVCFGYLYFSGAPKKKE